MNINPISIIQQTLNRTVFKKFPYGDLPLLLSCMLNGNGYFYSDVMGHYRVMSGGFTSKAKADREFGAKVNYRVAEGLRDFNRYTNGRYSKDVNHAANRYEYWAICKEHDFSFKMVRPKFAPFYVVILYRFVQSKMPWALNVYRRLKRFIRG